MRKILVIIPIHKSHHATIHNRSHWIILTPAFMRICIPIYISTRPATSASTTSDSAWLELIGRVSWLYKLR